MTCFVSAVLALALAAPSAFADKTCPAKPNAPASDSRACGASLTPTSICAEQADFVHPSGVGLEEMRDCANEMQNCACALIGSKNCASIDSTGRIVLGSAAKNPIERSKLSLDLDPVTGELVVMLDKETARKVSSAAHYTNDDEIGKMRIEEHTDLYRLTTAVALFDSARRFATNFDVAATEAGGGLTERAMSALQREFAMQSMWEQIAEGLRACHAMSAEATAEQPDATNWYFRNNLVCALRDGSELARYPVYASWPGCECHRGFGRILPGTETCVMNDIKADKFVEQPIDKRMPDMLSSFVRALEKRTGLKVKGIGTFGCGFERFETGPNVKELAQQPADRRALRANHISDHARATACDLAYVTFQVGDCDEWTFKMTTDADDPRAPPATGSKRPFFDALVHYLSKKGLDQGSYLQAGKRIVRDGAGAFYRNIEGELSKTEMKTPGQPGFGARDERDWQLRIGATVRDALVDTGFIVYDPTTNVGHRDHFHFEIPASESDYLTMATPDESGDALKNREAIVNRYLWRAAGLVEQGGGAH